MKINQLVTYAGGLYRVAGTNDNLLTLEGVADAQRNCRPRCTVLASDVTVVYARQCPVAADSGRLGEKVAQHTGGGDSEADS